MLSGSLPTGTVSSGREPSPATTDRSSTSPTTPRPADGSAQRRGAAPAPTEQNTSDPADRIATLESQNRALRAELARRETRREDLVDRYERLLERREQELEALRASQSGGDPASLRDRVLASVASVLQRW